MTPNSGLKVNAKDECQGRMRRAERQGRMQRVLNTNAQNLKQTLKLAAVVHHIKYLLSAKELHRY